MATSAGTAEVNEALARYHEVMKGKEYLPLYIGRITKDLALRAETELNETEESRARAIPELRRMIQDVKNLECATDDKWLLMFLRARKYDVQKAFALHKNYFDTKRDFPEIFGPEAGLEGTRGILRDGGGVFLPYRNHDGCAVVILQYAKWNPEEFSAVPMIQALCMVLMYVLQDDATQVTGVHVVIDVKGIGLKHLRHLTPRYVSLISRAMRNLLPLRFKGIHIYNESTIFTYLFSIFKLFLSEKIRNRIHFHGNSQKHLQKFVAKSILPTEYGGDNPAMNMKEFCDKMIVEFFPTADELLHQGYKK